ncbi:uncharacterized protein LOC144165811 [Haemaphysalis longicornis]
MGAYDEISFHSLPTDGPRRAKWLSFIRLANGEAEKLPGDVRLCSLHFHPRDFNWHLSVSGALGYAPKRRRLANTAVPSVLLPGQAAHLECLDSSADIEAPHAEGESHSGTPLDIGQYLHVEIEVQQSFDVATQTSSQTVGRDKGVQALVVLRGKSVAVQVDTMAKETCDKGTGVEDRDVGPVPTPVKR